MRILPAGLSHLSIDGEGVGFPPGKNQPGQVGRRRKNGRDPGSGGADRPVPGVSGLRSRLSGGGALRADPGGGEGGSGPGAKGCALPAGGRSEEHTSELQSRENLVCRLLLEKKNKQDTRDA